MAGYHNHAELGCLSFLPTAEVGQDSSVPQCLKFCTPFTYEPLPSGKGGRKLTRLAHCRRCQCRACRFCRCAKRWR